jgi:hypothetical protein
MVVDMWLKKASKKSKSKAAEKMQTTALNEVGQNRVLMSDGNWVIFDLWLKEPEKAKSFIGLFNLTS